MLREKKKILIFYENLWVFSAFPDLIVSANVSRLQKNLIWTKLHLTFPLSRRADVGQWPSSVASLSVQPQPSSSCFTFTFLSYFCCNMLQEKGFCSSLIRKRPLGLLETFLLSINVHLLTLFWQKLLALNKNFSGGEHPLHLVMPHTYR